MLHLADDVRNMGPSWVYWCFVMERYCGSLLPGIKSRSNPYPTIAKRMLEAAQLSQIKRLYPELEKRLQRESAEVDEDGEPTTRHEQVYEDCQS